MSSQSQSTQSQSIQSQPSQPSQSPANLPFFALYQEYTTYSISTLKSLHKEFTVSDICILMAIQSQCLLSAKTTNKINSSLQGYCMQPSSFFENQFFFTRQTVYNSLKKLQELNLIKITKETNNPFSTAKITLSKDFSISTIATSDQNFNIADEYSGKSKFVKIYFNTFKKDYIKNRPLSATDILVYNIIYSFIYNNDYNATEECNKSLFDISMLLPVSKQTISRSIQNLKYYDLIGIKKTTNPQDKKSANSIKTLTILQDIVHTPAEEFIDF